MANADDVNTRPVSPNDGPDAREPPTGLDDATGQKLLAAIEEVRDEARERDKRTDARFERLESRLEEAVAEGRTNTKNIAEQADALTRVASAAAKAVDLALEAKRQLANTTDDTTKIVQSALQIHGASIAMTVDAAVNKAVEPIKSDIAELKRSDEAQTLAMKAQDGVLADQNAALKDHGEKIDTVVKSVGTIATGVSKLVTWRSHWAIKAAAIVGIALGAAAYGYCNARTTNSADGQRTQQLPTSTGEHGLVRPTEH